MAENKRSHFGGAIATLAVVAGSAVGLGNIWRFPYELGMNGGGAFLLVYLLCTALMGIPLMIAELSLGRMGQANVVGAFARVSGGNRWRWLGFAGALCAFLIMGFYSVVCGWSLFYVWQALAHGFADLSPEGLENLFGTFIEHPWKPIFWMCLVLLLMGTVIVLGVKRGIEQTSKVLMPVLLILIVVLCVRSITLPGGMAGLEFLFYPDFSKINSSVILSAMGQAFFSLSLGMGIMVTYGSYVPMNDSIPRTSLQITVLDTLVAVLAAVAIFPAVFSMGIEPSAGPKLAFITLPSVFNQIPGGYVWAVVFFMLFFIAALTSAISLMEVTTAYVSEEMHVSRRTATMATGVLIALTGVVCSFSFGILKADLCVGRYSVFDLLDMVTSKFIMPVSGLAIAYFMAWRVDARKFEEQFMIGRKMPQSVWKTYRFILKYVAPIGIALVLFDQIRSIF